jgi:hypothetical protein
VAGEDDVGPRILHSKFVILDAEEAWAWSDRLGTGELTTS